MNRESADLNPFAPRPYGQLQKITDAVYLFRNITNSSFIIGSRGVAVIDTQVNLPTAQRVLDTIRSITDKPILYVVNTHYHWDHTNGNELFKASGGAVIASSMTREFMISRAPRQKEFLSGRGFELGQDPLLPEITFQGEYCFDLGSMPVRLFYAGSAETQDATAVHVMSEGVVMSGDTVMTGSFPIFGQPVWDEGLDGTGQWERTIGKLMELEPKHILPGHGPLAGQAEINLLIRIQNYFIENVRTCVQKGYSIQQTLDEMEPRLPAWIREIPLVWGTPRYAILRVYRSLTAKNGGEPGWQQFKPSAIPAADPSILTERTRSLDTATAYLELAREAAEGGDKTLELSVLQKAAKRFSKTPDVLAAYAECLIEASRGQASVLEKGDFFDAARRAWDQALAVNSDHLPSLLGKGRYLTMMAFRGGDDPKPGMKLLSRVLEKNTGGRVQAEAEFYLGIGYRRLAEEPKAREFFNKALLTDPAFMPARMALSA